MNSIVHHKKLRLGALYGMVGGLAFSLLAWGADAWMLAQANAVYFWVKFIPGLFISVALGGIAGWLTVLIHRHGFALLLWGLLGAVYSWLVVWLPFTAAPAITSLLDPSLADKMNYSTIQDMNQFRIVSLLIVGVVAIICGLLELNLIDQAILSPYISGTVMAMLVCAVLFGLIGSAADHMINTTLREPVQVINNMLQFAQENAGVDVPKATARKMHLSATYQLGELVHKPRRLTLISVDENLVMMNILVDFEGTQVVCSTIFAQPTDCIILTSNP